MADLDLLTLAEGYQAVNIPSASGHDLELGSWITGISERIDELCGPVVARAITAETHDGGRHRIPLRKAYATAASSVVEYDLTVSLTLDAETPGTQPAEAYLLDPVGNGELVWVRRRSAGMDWQFPRGRRNVVVTYTAGRAADTASVAPKFKVATGAILRRLWQRDQGGWARGANPFDDDGDAGIGFWRVVDPMIAEWLPGELLNTAVA